MRVGLFVALIVPFFLCCQGAPSWGARRDLISSFEILMESEYDQMDALLDTSMSPVQISWRPKYGFSLVARHDIPKGSHVLDVPKKTALHRSVVFDTVPLIGMLFKGQEVSEASVLAVFLSHMKKKINTKKPTSLLGAHLGLMFYGPSEPFPNKEKNLDGCGWWEVEGESEVGQLLEDEWESVKGLIPKTALKVDEEGFKRALLVVLSRGFSFNIEGDDNLAIIPYLDLLNHHPSGGATIKFYPPALGDYFEITATRDYAKGEQIFIDYGGFANRKLLAEYGFALENNPHDVILFNSDYLGREYHSELANEVLDGFTGGDRRIIISRGEVISNRTLSALRLVCGFKGFYSSQIADDPDSCEEGGELKFLSLISLALPTFETHSLFRDKIEEIAKKHDLSLPPLSRSSSPPASHAVDSSSFSPSRLRDVYIPVLSAENEICVTQQLFYSAAAAYHKDQGNCEDFIFRNLEEGGLEELQTLRDSLAPLKEGEEREINREEEEEEEGEGKEVQRREERKLYLKFLLLVSNKLKVLKAAEEAVEGREWEEREGEEERE